MPTAQTNLGLQAIDPQQGFGFRDQPRPEYLQALDNVLTKLDDPRNMWMSVGMPWLYHGTSARNAASILQKGFDPGRIGEIWGHVFGQLKGRAGPGVYFSKQPIFARTWGEVAGNTPAVVRAYVPRKNILEAPDIHGAYDRARAAEQARAQGYQAVSFPDETVVMDPTSIPLRNIRPFPGPQDQKAIELWNKLGFQKELE